MPSAMRKSPFALAREIVAGQRAALECAFAGGLRRCPPAMLLDIEEQFLWGVYSELVARRPPGKVGRHELLLTHLIAHFAATRNISFTLARDAALALERLFNQAEPLFEAIAERGRLAAKHGGCRHFIEVVEALQEAKTGKGKR